jgi:hypothetical protein
MNFTLQRGKRYKATIQLGFVERLASNDLLADKFRSAGFTEVKVTGVGETRQAVGVWNADEIRATYPPQISDLSEVVA